LSKEKCFEAADGRMSETVWKQGRYGDCFVCSVQQLKGSNDSRDISGLRATATAHLGLSK